MSLKSQTDRVDFDTYARRETRDGAILVPTSGYPKVSTNPQRLLRWD